jgi:hypothetical protein
VDGCINDGIPVELRTGNNGAQYVILRRVFPHRKRDKRLALFVAVPIRFVVDELPPV